VRLIVPLPRLNNRQLRDLTRALALLAAAVATVAELAVIARERGFER
jgi:hypothetical protein